jgi:hypothetical protein
LTLQNIKWEDVCSIFYFILTIVSMKGRQPYHLSGEVAPTTLQIQWTFHKMYTTKFCVRNGRQITACKIIIRDRRYIFLYIVKLLLIVDRLLSLLSSSCNSLA